MVDRLHAETIEDNLTSKYLEIWKTEDDEVARKEQLEGVKQAAESLQIALSGETIERMAARKYLNSLLEDNDDLISKSQYDKVSDFIETVDLQKAQDLLEEVEGLSFRRFELDE